MTVIASILAGLVGAAACWLVLRPALAERRQLRAELDRRELAFRDELARRDAELDVARGQLLDARAGAAASAARLATLEEKLPETVRSISQETLDASREAFLSQAGERVEKTLLPVQQRLGDLRKLVDETEARRLEDGGRLTAQLELLSAGTRSLAVALGSTQSRGRWGEIQLERILEFVGMEQGVDYPARRESRAAVRTSSCTSRAGRTSSSTRRRPSTSSSVPHRRGARRSVQQRSPRSRARSALHVQELGRKGYWAHVTPSPDFTFMFLPGDAYLAAAEEQDAELFTFAYERGVLLATPRTIVVMLRTIRVAWQNENASDHADAVLKVATELHERLTTMAEHLAKVGRGLDSAVSAYNKAVGSYGSRVLVSARRLEGLATTRSTSMTSHR